MASTAKAHSFHIHTHQKHFKWNRSLKPVMTVSSGSAISFDLLDGGNNQITASSTIADVIAFDNAKADPVFGPIYIEDAEPGDVLKVEILDLMPGPYAWTATMKGFGVIHEDFPEPFLKIWDLSPEVVERGWTELKKGVKVPVRPFLGVIGVAPEEEGEFSTIPPRDVGGNIDCKYVTKGATLYLPVKVKGALFSCGDGHGAQGDGEVGGCAMETPMKATLRLTVEKNMPWVKAPQYETCPAMLRQGEILAKGEYGTLGIDEDMFQACKKACRAMVEWLVSTKGMTKDEALVLMTVAGDLRIAEVVDMPNHAVAMTIPLIVFEEEEKKDQVEGADGVKSINGTNGVKGHYQNGSINIA